MKKDTPWTPGGFPPSVALSAHLALMVMMVVRGMDYATGESATAAHRLGAVESAAPLWMWGIVFTTAAAVGLVSMSWRWSGGVIAAHILGAGLYAAVGVGITIDAFARIEDTGGSPSWVVIIPVVAFVLTAAGAWRMRALSVPVTVVAAGAIALGLASIGLDGLRNATVLYGVAALHATIAVGTAQITAQERIRRDRDRGQ